MSTATAIPELHRRRPFLLRIHAGKSNPGHRRRLPEHRFSCPLPPVSLFGPASRRPWRAALPLGCKQRETVRGREEGQSALVPPRRGRTTCGPPSPHRRGAGEELPERREPRPGLLCLGEGGGSAQGPRRVLVFLNVNYRNTIKIPVLVMAPRNAEYFLVQLLRSKNILNHELFRKRIEYTGVAFYPVSIPRRHLYFRREGGGVKILLN